MSTGENGGRVAHDDHHDEDGPRPVHGGPDTTLGGYFLEHRRPPGFEGVDGEPYTVALEVEKTPNLASPFEGYLVFPRWAATGLGVVGHVETPTLASGRSREGVLEELGQIPLGRVKALLDEAIGRQGPRGTGSGDPKLHTGGVDGVEEKEEEKGDESSS